MQYRILHESSKRIRIHTGGCMMTMREADLLEFYLREQPFVTKVKVYDRIGEAVVFADSMAQSKEKILQSLDEFSYEDERLEDLVPRHSVRELNREYANRLIRIVAGQVLRRLFLPPPLQILWTALQGIRFIARGWITLVRSGLKVPVLDAVAIAASMLRGDFSTAGSVMFLLNAGEIIEEWTHKRSVDDLANTMSLKVDRVWRKTETGEEQVDIREIEEGDVIVVRTSDVIPMDGKIVEGLVTINQASMTGESIPVPGRPGGYVYGGTVVEEGRCLIEVTKTAGAGRYDQIVRMIEESEKLKSNTESKAFHLADRLVPYSLAGAALTWLVTRNVSKALSFLMVDFSCALKLSMPLSVLSAMREAGGHDISVKGGKFLEAVAQAETMVFDKTGTLTHEMPTVKGVVTFDGADETEALRVAACLEEHYPHSVANAVVKEIADRGISHEEMHSEVEYVVAHGISSLIEDEKAIIGSYHFVFEDEGTVVPEGEEEKLETLPEEYTHLYLAIGGRLKAAICIEDPLREEAADVIRQLRKVGFSKICMMTGDNKRTAQAVAKKLDLDEFYYEVLPEDKAAFIRKEHDAGRAVVMIGDGVNDAPALSEADAGIAIKDGAAIAGEVADIIISADDLGRLITLKQLSNALMKRIDTNYRFIIGFNAALIALGVIGILPPSASALLHNGSTIISGLRSMTKLLPAPEAKTISEKSVH